MGQQFRTWRCERGDRQWLSTLVDAMEEVSRPEVRAEPCDPVLLAALYAQLARPASTYPYGGSAVHLRN